MAAWCQSGGRAAQRRLSTRLAYNEIDEEHWVVIEDFVNHNTNMCMLQALGTARIIEYASSVVHSLSDSTKLYTSWQ